MLPCLTENERAAVPPLFKCKYLTEPVNRYTINMDPLKGAGAWMLPQGSKGRRVKSKKSHVDPLDQYWLNFAISSSPPPKPVLWATTRLYLIVSHYQQLWHLLLTQIEIDMETNARLSKCPQNEKSIIFHRNVWDLQQYLLVQRGQEKDYLKM